MLRTFDVTLTLAHGMPVYPGEPPPERTPLKRLANGDSANVSRLALGLHTGTHVDAPVHFIEGAAGVETLPLDILIGPARVVEIGDPTAITVEELSRAALDGVRRVLFKTRNGELWGKSAFDPNFVYLTPDSARWLVERGIRLVGVDYLSVEAFGAAEPAAHRTLLAAGVVIVEGLDLRAPAGGAYELFCLPLKIAGADGAPARVVLRAAAAMA